ncbi:MAG: hypothetical protein AAGA77_23630 [Bacteroidota bacterium]
MKPLSRQYIVFLLAQFLWLILEGANLQAQTITSLNSFQELSYKNVPFEQPFILSVKIPEEIDKVKCWIFYKHKKNNQYLPFDPNVQDSLKLETAIYKKDTQKHCDILIKPLHANESYQFKFKIWRSKKLSANDQDLFKKQVPKIVTKHVNSYASMTNENLALIKKEVEAFLTEKFDFNVDRLRTWNDEKYSVHIEEPPWSGFIRQAGRLKSEYDSAKVEYISTADKLETHINGELLKSLNQWFKEEKSLTKKSKEVWETKPVISDKEYKNLSIDQIMKILSLEVKSGISKLLKGNRKIQSTGDVTQIEDLSKDIDLENKNIELLKASFYILLSEGLFNNRGTLILEESRSKMEDIVRNLDQLINHKNDLKKFSPENYISEFPKELSRLYNIENKTYQIDTEVDAFLETSKNPYIGLDLGLGYEPQSQSFYIYEGINFYFVPVNKRTPFSLYRNEDCFWKRFSLFLSFSQNIGSAKSDAFLPLVNPGGNNSGFQGNLMFGYGYRITRIARVNFALVATKANNYNPFEDNQLKLLPTLNLSMELDVAKGIQTIFGLN